MHSTIALSVLALCCSVLAAPQLPDPSTIKWVKCSENVPTTLDTTGIDIKKLPSTLHCGQIDVPMDYSKPMSASNNITLGLAMYRPAKSKGVLFVNTGGSDAVAVLAWQVALNQTDMFSGLLDFDLMMMDIRGTFSSNPLNVSLETLGAIPPTYPTNQSEFHAYQAASAAFIQSWIDSSSPPGIVQYVSTKEVVQDYERIRKALGYQKIHFLGESYGSFRAAQYASTFPQRVDRFVLDAVAPNGRSLFDKAQDNIASVNRGLLRADAYCQNNCSCSFRSLGKGGVPKVFLKLLAAAKESSPAAALGLRQAMLNSLSGQPDFPAIFDFLSQLLKGNTSSLTGGSPPTVESVVGLPLECGDVDDESFSFSEFQKSLATGLKHDPSMIGMTLSWQIPLICSAWPFPPSPPRASSFKHPMLLVTADFDVDAPTEWTTFTWEQTPDSALVVRHGDDHVSFPLVDQPSTLITKEYLRTGVLPSVRDETLVTVYRHGMRRAPISDPYEVPTGAIAGDVDSEVFKNPRGSKCDA